MHTIKLRLYELQCMTIMFDQIQQKLFEYQINPMFRNNVYSFKTLPVQERQRKWTDCFCTICTAIFALSLFILSFIMYHKKNFYETNFPVDDTGKTCAYEYKTAPFIYFLNPNDMSKDRYCVSKCPGYLEPISCTGSNTATCVALGGSKYQTEGVINRLGAFCIATDQTVADHMWNSPQTSVKFSILQSLDVIWLSLLFAFLLGLLFLVLVFLLPKIVIYLVFVGAFIVLMFAGIFILAKPVHFFHPNIWNILLAVILIISALVFVAYIGFYRKQLELASIFLNHANTFLKQTPMVFGYIPLFLILTFGLIVLVVWQYVAFGTQFEPYIQKQGDLYKSSKHNIALQIFNAIEFLWGLQFLRDAFNFVVSGNAVEWYFRNEDNNYKKHCFHPLTRMITKNWGSIAGGSFLNAFFSLFDLVSDCFRCDSDGSCGKCNGIYKKCCCCDYVFQLVRNDAYAYINLTGIPYCNAARQSEALCQYSQHFRGSRSCLRLYRVASHVFIVTLVAIIAYAILGGRTSYINWYIIALIVLAAYCISTYFIDLHANAADGLMICYLSQKNCQGQEMQVCPLPLQEDLYLYNTHNNR